MEIQYFYPLLLAFLLFKLFKTLLSPKLKLPPGPRKLPIIGNLHNLLRSKLPHHALKDLAELYGPLMHLKLGEVSTIVVTSGAVGKEILKTHDRNFSSRADNLAVKIMIYDGADMIFSPYGDFWRQLRKLFVTELMSAKRVQSFQPIREHEALNFMRIVSDARGEVNITELLHSYTNNVTARVAFGNKCEDGEMFSREMKKSVELASGFMAADLFPSWASIIGLVNGMKGKLEKCHRNVDMVLGKIIEEHKERRGREVKGGGGGDGIVEENFLDVLFKLQAEGGLGFKLTSTNIKAIIFDVFGAGSGTSASSMTWTMSALMRNPRVMKKAQAEVRHVVNARSKITESDIRRLTYLKLVIKESLRLHPPAPLLVPRESTEKCEIQGYDIPAKTKVVFNAWAMGRDPRVWVEPEEFMPERFEGSSMDFNGSSFEYIPFGGGRRMCPGILFGMATMEVALAHLLYYFDWSLPGGVSEVDMSEVNGIGARKRFDLKLCASEPFVALPLI